MQKRVIPVILIFVFLLAACQAKTETPVPVEPTEMEEGTAADTPPAGEEEESDPTQKAVPTEAADKTTQLPPAEGVLLGVYPRGFVQNTIEEIVAFDEWIASTGKRVSIAATFMNFNDPDLETHVPDELETAWERGYISFVNLSVGELTAEEIALGKLDDRIGAWARAYAAWSQDGERRAFIAPLQEMNGYWTSYGKDPENFKRAYRRIREIFYGEGVSPEAVSWVFAPNGWSPEGHEFERYYPGDDVVDVVGFSSFNFGDCSSYPLWEEYEDIFKPYLDRMRAMAPGKPIFIAEIGTVGAGGDKDQWLIDTYHKLADYPNLHAILYFNRGEFGSSLPSCEGGANYRIFDYQTQEGYQGFLEAISIPEVVYYPPDSPQMGAIMFSRP